VLNLELIALAVRQIFARARKFKFRSPKLDHVPFDLVLHAVKIVMHTPHLKSLALAVLEISGSVYLKFGRRPSSCIRH